MAEKAITRRLKIYVNGKEVDATITNLRKNLTKFRAQANRATEGSDKWKEYNAEVAKLELELKQAYAAQRAFRQDIKLTEQGIGDAEQTLSKFTQSFSTMVSGYRSGDVLQIKEGWQGVRTGISGATKAALAFIATPLGAAITLLVGVGAAAKKWFEYNQQVTEALNLTTQLTGLTDRAADAARIRTESLVENFGVDFQQTMLTANSLVNQFGISFDEAFDVIQEKLVRGQDKNDEFFSSLNEYPVFFKRAGFSVQEFANIIETGYDLGIYTDKLPDALKEATLSIEEQTQSSRDALVSAFGEEFTNSLFDGVRNGSITAKDAIALMAEETEKQGLNAQQAQLLTADLFRGAGEDAGGALKIFEAVNQALNEQQRELTESEQITQRQIEATNELKQVSSALFATGSDGFGLLIDKAKLLGTEILVDILKIGVDLTNWFIDLNNKSATFSGIITFIGEVGQTQVKILITAFQNLGEAVGGVGDIVEGIFTRDFDLVKQGFARNTAAGAKFYDDLKNKAVESAEKIKSAFNGDNQLERVNLDDFISGGDSELGGNATGSNQRTLEQIEADKKAAAERLKILEDFENRKRKLLQEAAIREAEDDFARQQLKLQQDFAAKQREIEALKVSDAQKQELLALLEDERLAKENELNAQKEEAELQKIRDFEQRKRDLKNEIELENKSTEEEKEIFKAELEFIKKEEELAKLQLTAEETKQLKELLTEQEEIALANIRKKYQDKKEKSENEARKKDLEARRRLNNQIIDGAVDLAGRESRIGQALLAVKGIMASKEILIQLGVIQAKAAGAVAEGTLSTTVGAANTAKAGFPQNIPLLIAFAAQAAGIITAIKGAVKGAKSAKSSVPSFYDGGFTFGGGNTGGVDGRGGRLAIFHPNEYVIPSFVRNDPEVPQIEQYLESKRLQKLGRFEEGGPVSTTNTVAPTKVYLDDGIKALMQRLYERLSEPFVVDYSYDDVQKQKEIADQLETVINESKGK